VGERSKKNKEGKGKEKRCHSQSEGKRLTCKSRKMFIPANSTEGEMQKPESQWRSKVITEKKDGQRVRKKNGRREMGRVPAVGIFQVRRHATEIEWHGEE